MNPRAEQVVAELQAVLNQHRAALFFSPDTSDESEQHQATSRKLGRGVRGGDWDDYNES